jgi:hypothetical protein
MHSVGASGWHECCFVVGLSLGLVAIVVGFKGYILGPHFAPMQARIAIY